MNKIHWKIIYVNLAVILAFISAFTLAIMVLMGHVNDRNDVEIAIISMCLIITSGSFTFWTFEIKYLFTHLDKKGD